MKVYLIMYVGPEWCEVKRVCTDSEYANAKCRALEEKRKKLVASYDPHVGGKPPPNWVYESISKYTVHEHFLDTSTDAKKPAPRAHEPLPPPKQPAPPPVEDIVVQCATDLRKLYGVSPYNTPANVLCGDALFARGIEEKYAQSTLEEAHRKLKRVCSMTSTKTN